VPSTILILDPLTLKGRELLSCSDRLGETVAEWQFRHTDLDDEHQIADIGSGPVLVPPLEGPDNLVGANVIVVASDGWSSRHEHLRAHLDDHPDTLLLDLSGFTELRSITIPTIGGKAPEARQLRLGHPALYATSRVAEVLSFFGMVGGSLAVVDPASAFGHEGVEILARQAAQRVQGAQVDERIQGHILAFSTVAIESDELQEDAGLLFPEMPLAVTRTLSGCFHGHLAHLSLCFERRLETDEVGEALGQADQLEIQPLPLHLDSVPDRDGVIVTPPWFSPDGRQLALTMMADGLRVGGALTAVEILESIL
jgi:hypothetical protein